MNAHVSSILLGVRDMDRSKRFYTEGLGWKVQRDYRVSVFFVPNGGSLVGFYGRDGLAANVGVSPEGSGFSGLVLTYVVRSEARVDEIMAEAEQAGATILKPAATQQWGGYGGSFADPDGYIWDIGYSAQGNLGHRLQRPGKGPALRGVAAGVAVGQRGADAQHLPLLVQGPGGPVDDRAPCLSEWATAWEPDRRDPRARLGVVGRQPSHPGAAAPVLKERCLD